ncbi:L,D-transpeptidase family protein [Sphingobium sp.]|uniref:L,D-transpeptidase family protein n=1 Tax=Sphingobium sp. TaxID=1912891 RepID=UPI002B6DED2D|nr:L,D-transpeptidase family protein [Sphingobium sp.]HUD90369.1 L,D-transpeptidase family protein [Sphingobium sp.]
MAGLFKTLAKSAGPKLAIGLGLGGAALLAMQWIDRPAAQDAASADVAEGRPAAAPLPAPTKPMERRSDQPMDIDPRALAVKRVLKIDGPFRHGDYAWDDTGAPTTGPVIITIDLKAETLSVFRAGYEIGAAVILYGATDKPSPQGAFPITQKDADHVSNLYDAPMPYAQRLTSDGVFIHGSDVEYGRGTHGCIGVPVEFAKKLFAVTKVGDVAVITNGKMLDVSKAQVGG